MNITSYNWNSDTDFPIRRHYNANIKLQINCTFKCMQRNIRKKSINSNKKLMIGFKIISLESITSKSIEKQKKLEK